MKSRTIYTYLLGAAAVIAFALTLVSVHRHGVASSQRELMRAGLEDTARRVRNTTRNLRSAIGMSDEAAKAKAKGFARLIAADPSVLRDQARLDGFRIRMDVEELQVVNSNGVAVADVGVAAAGGEPATRLQYAEAPRLDGPGSVRIGYAASRLDEVRKMADLTAIAESAGRNYSMRVEIGAPSGLPPTEGSLTADCAGYRIRVTPLQPPSPLARMPVLLTLIALDCTVLLFLFSGVIPAVRKATQEQLRSLSVLFRRDAVGHRVSFFFWRRTLAITALFALVTALYWSWTYRACRTEVGNSVKRAAEDCRKEIIGAFDAKSNAVTEIGAIDEILLYIGSCICERYGCVAGITDREITEIMHRYDIDEINVEDEYGFITASSIGITSKDNSKIPGPAAFFERLVSGGRRTFSQHYRESVDEPGVIRKYVGVVFPKGGGFVQLGFDESRLLTDYRQQFEGLALERTLDHCGFMLSIREDTGGIESCGHPAYRKGMSPEDVGLRGGLGAVPGAAPADRAMTPGAELFEAELFGERCLCGAVSVAKRRIIVAAPLSDVRGDCVESARGFTVAIAAVFLLVIWLMNRLFGINASLEAFRREDTERRSRDLATARTIQLSSLPAVLPDRPDFKVFARMTPAREVGGDFFDCFRMPDRRIAVLIADVSGKGVPAAMFMMKAKTEIRAAMLSGGDPAAAVTAVNAKLAANNEADMFVTAWIGCYDRRTGEIEYVNAGHNPPLIRRDDGSVAWLRGRRSLPLAAMDGVRYRADVLRLAPGDSLLLYTDGVTEATNAAGEFYGEERLERTLAAAGRKFVSGIDAALAAFVGGAEQADDITMLALDRKKEEPA